MHGYSGFACPTFFVSDDDYMRQFVALVPIRFNQPYGVLHGWESIGAMPPSSFQQCVTRRNTFWGDLLLDLARIYPHSHTNRRILPA
jgi:hypothetical protein